MLHTPHPPTPRLRARSRRRLRAVALLASAVSVCLVAASAPPTPLGVGDRLFPQLGNPGYDVAAYDLSFTYSGSNNEPLKAVTTIEARTTADLDRINLDFAHGKVDSVEVDGDPAGFATAGEDLVVTPEDALDEETGRGSPCGTAATRCIPRTVRAAGCAPPTDWPWPTRRTSPTWCSPATTIPPTRRGSPSTSPPPTGSRPSRTACRPAWTAPAHRPPGPTGARTPWPPNWPKCPSAAPRCCTAPGRTDCPSGTWCRPSTARRSNRGWRRPPARSRGWSRRSGATPSRRTACSWPTPPPASNSRPRHSPSSSGSCSPSRPTRSGTSSRSWCTSWPTRGSATASARPPGPTCGSTRATPPGTRRCTRRRPRTRPWRPV